MASREPPGGHGDATRPTEPLRAPVPPPPARREPRPAAVAPPLVEERVPPPYPPEDPWWSNGWAAFTVGLIALLLGAVIGYAVGDSNSSSATGTHTATVTNTRTVTQPKVSVQTVTSNTVTQAPPNAANEQRRVEAEANDKKLEKENEELRRQTAEGG